MIIINKYKFKAYQDEILTFIDNDNIESVFYTINIVKESYDLTKVQRWKINYINVMCTLFYTDDWEWDEMCNYMLDLRLKAINISHEEKEYLPEDNILEEYVSLLYHFLRLHFFFPESLAEYIEIAEELYQLVTTIDFGEELDNDLYPFVNLVLGDIYALDGRLLLQEKYLRNIEDRYKNEEAISIYAFIGLCDLASARYLLGRKDEAAELYFWLFDCILEGNINVTDIDDMDLFSIVQNSVQNIVIALVDLVSIVNKEEAVRMLQITMIDTQIIQHNDQDDSYWKLCVQYLVLMDCCNKKIEKHFLYKIVDVMSELTEERLEREQGNQGYISFFMGSYFLKKACDVENAIESIDNIVFLNEKYFLIEMKKISYLSNIGSALCIYDRENMVEQALKCSEIILNKLVSFYALSELDQDNDKLEQYLGLCDDAFKRAYPVLADSISCQRRLEYRINYKNVMGTLIRLRNKYGNNLKREKTEKDFPFFHYSQLLNVMPENTVIIDFLYYRKIQILESIQRNDYYKGANLEVIVVSNQKEATIESFPIEGGEALNETVMKFKNAVGRKNGKCKKSGTELCKILFGSFVELLKEAEHIIISPDYILSNLPFDLILEYVDIHKSIIYVTSLRSLFEFSGKLWDKSSCVIGDPKYETNKQFFNEIKSEERDSLNMEFPELRFSRYEAAMVAKNVNGECFVGLEATKYVIRPGYRILHIATHGVVPQRYDNPWYESGLVFAGAVDYMITNHEDTIYGDGMLSAEEISRMQLENTELTVLSACKSGQSILSRFQQPSGLHIAFGAAGVKYIISALWEVDDLATMFFMSFFYQKLKKGYPVPDSLYHAKNRLRNITAGEIQTIIRQDRELYIMETADMLQWLQDMPKDYCLYKAPYYWDAFVCYQYKF